MAPRYKVTLTKEERKDLEVISTKGKRAARTILYARALLFLVELRTQGGDIDVRLRYLL